MTSMASEVVFGRYYILIGRLILNHFGDLGGNEAVRDLLRPFEVLRGLWRPFEAFRGLWRPFEPFRG